MCGHGRSPYAWEGGGRMSLRLGDLGGGQTRTWARPAGRRSPREKTGGASLPKVRGLQMRAYLPICVARSYTGSTRVSTMVAPMMIKKIVDEVSSPLDKSSSTTSSFCTT